MEYSLVEENKNFFRVIDRFKSKIKTWIFSLYSFYISLRDLDLRLKIFYYIRFNLGKKNFFFWILLDLELDSFRFIEKIIISKFTKSNIASINRKYIRKWMKSFESFPKNVHPHSAPPFNIWTYLLEHELYFRMLIARNSDQHNETGHRRMVEPGRGNPSSRFHIIMPRFSCERRAPVARPRVPRRTDRRVH